MDTLKIKDTSILFEYEDVVYNASNITHVVLEDRLGTAVNDLRILVFIQGRPEPIVAESVKGPDALPYAARTCTPKEEVEEADARNVARDEAEKACMFFVLCWDSALHEAATYSRIVVEC